MAHHLSTTVRTELHTRPAVRTGHQAIPIVRTDHHALPNVRTGKQVHTCHQSIQGAGIPPTTCTWFPTFTTAALNLLDFPTCRWEPWHQESGPNTRPCSASAHESYHPSTASLNTLHSDASSEANCRPVRGWPLIFLPGILFFPFKTADFRFCKTCNYQNKQTLQGIINDTSSCFSNIFE